MCDDVNELQRAHVWIVSKMTHCGATISYAVCLLTTEPTTCVPLFLLSCLNDFFFFCLVIPRQLPCDCTEKLTRQKRRKKNPQHTPEFVPAHLFFPISLFFQLLRKTKTKAHHRWPTVVNPKSSSARRPGRSFCQDSRENPNEGASHSVVEWVTWPERRGLRAQGVGGGGRGCHRWWGQSPPAPICWEREPLFA